MPDRSREKKILRDFTSFFFSFKHFSDLQSRFIQSEKLRWSERCSVSCCVRWTMREKSNVWSDEELLVTLPRVWSSVTEDGLWSRVDGPRRGRMMRDSFERGFVRHVCVLTLDFVTVKYSPVVYVALRHFIILYIFVRRISAPTLIWGSYLKDVWMDEDGYM